MKIAVALSDLSASEISLKAGLSVNVLGKYMRGETMISFANMQAVCDVLGIPLALITTERQITPARIRLMKALERMSEDELEAFIAKETGRE
jgi:transcriptional regulator with XRE-family HTH domain